MWSTTGLNGDEKDDRFLFIQEEMLSQREILAGILITSTSTVIVGGLALKWIFPIPKSLPDRLDRIAEDAVEIDNDELYENFDWWHVSKTK